MNRTPGFMHDELAIRVLTILKLDAKSLYDRLVNYYPEYVNILTLRRTREHFKDLFRSKYDSITMEDLRRCGQEVIVELDRFYSKVYSIKWYLYHTEDMPNRIQDFVQHELKDLEKIYHSLEMYINAEWSSQKDEGQKQEVI